MKIGIVGLGLIGGSLGLDFRRLGHEVLGVARRAATGDAAIACGAVDHASTDLKSLNATDIVFLCTPIHVIESIAIDLVPHLLPHTILTDVGSVNGAIVYPVTHHLPNSVGGPPIATSIVEAKDLGARALVSTEIFQQRCADLIAAVDSDTAVELAAAQRGADNE